MWKFSSLAALALLIGCSSDPAGDPATTEDAAGDEAGATDAAPSETSSDVGAGETASAGKPATPTITGVMPMSGAWHVTWKTNDAALTKVELWRSNDGADATLVKALAGTAKDWHDAAAPGTVVKYCWKVKTIRGTEASELSAERCSK